MIVGRRKVRKDKIKVGKIEMRGRGMRQTSERIKAEISECLINRSSVY